MPTRRPRRYPFDNRARLRDNDSQPRFISLAAPMQCPRSKPFADCVTTSATSARCRDVVTPPYDVISPEFQDELYKKHPANFIRLELNREEPGDNEQTNKYTRAARFLKNWRQEGVLQVDPDPALYVYHQTFQHAGQEVTRRGFMGRVRLERFGEGKIYPHEETHSGPKAGPAAADQGLPGEPQPDFWSLSRSRKRRAEPARRRRRRADAADRDRSPGRRPSHVAGDECEGASPTSRRSWTPSRCSSPTAIIATRRPATIAMAGRARAARRQPSGQLRADAVREHERSRACSCCRRIGSFAASSRSTSDLLQSQLGDSFHDAHDRQGRRSQRRRSGRTSKSPASKASSPSTRPRTTPGRTPRITPQGETPPGRARRRAQRRLARPRRLDPAPPGDGEPAPAQGAAQAHVRPLAPRKSPRHLHKGDTVGRDATGQMGAGGRFELAALVMPATVDHVRAISEHGERMPAKSTYFYPKLLGGMVVHLLE